MIVNIQQRKALKKSLTSQEIDTHIYVYKVLPKRVHLLLSLSLHEKIAFLLLILCWRSKPGMN